MNYTIGLTAAFATICCWTIGTLSFTRASILAPPLSVNRVRLLYATFALTLINLLIFGISPFDLLFAPSTQQWVWLGISGIIGLTIGDFFAFSAFKMIGSSRSSLFNTTAPIAAFLLGILLLDENINLIGIAGMSISISGVLWFTWSTQHEAITQDARANFSKGMIYAALGAICQGLGLVCAKRGLTLDADYHISPIQATWMRMTIATLTTYFIGFFRTNLMAELKTITFTKEILKPVLTGTFFGPVVGVTLSLLAATNMEVSLTQTILSLLPISVMFAAVVTGREKVHASAFIAALISIFGVILLVWRNEIAGGSN